MTGNCDRICVEWSDSYLDEETATKRILIADRDYQCIECQCAIPRGQQYEEVEGDWADRITDETEHNLFRTCLPCRRIRDDYFDCYNFGSLEEDFFNEFGFSPYAIPDEE